MKKKPHIRLGGHNGTVMFVCFTDFKYGWGATPAEAYKNWKCHGWRRFFTDPLGLFSY